MRRRDDVDERKQEAQTRDERAKTSDVRVVRTGTLEDSLAPLLPSV